jgi:hypothetical protein
MHGRRFAIFVSLICALSCARVRAAQSTATPAAPERPTARAVRLDPDEEITIDGRLDERSWERAEPLTNFTQSEPRNGEPGTERSEIRILFSANSLYIGARFDDSDPKGMLGNQMIRDGSLSADDRFMWVLDPFDDQRSGYFFEVNPAGAMGDAQLVPASGGGAFGVSQNRAWNGIWLARVRRHDQGWTVEVEIPFRTLNFDPASTEWGANFQRTVRRKSEENFWSGWARNQGLYNLASAGRIVGISNVSQGHGLDIKPYVLGTYTQTPIRRASALFKGNEGIDFFYSFTPQLKANLTINTDFAQTEVDDRQVNLSRFPVFFPEKRDFFLESAGNFDFSREPSTDMTAFFSRRIGLDANGQPQDIDYGMKMAGSVGRFNLGLMHVRTGEDNATRGEEFTIFRPKRQFLRQSSAGLIYTRRATRGSGIPDRHTIGADFQLATSRFHGSQNLQLTGYFVKTPDGVRNRDDAAWGFRLLYPNDRWSGRVIFKEIDKNFDPAVGFRERIDFREYNQRLKFAPRPKNSRIVRQAGAELWVDLFTDTAGRWIERNNSAIFDIELQSGDTANFTINPIWERLQGPFRIAQGITLPMGNEYSYLRYSLSFTTADRRTIALDGNVADGSFYSGHRRDLRGTLTLRPRRGVLAQLTAQFNRVELAEGRFTTKLLRSVINTQFSPFVSVSNNIQYDSVSRLLGWQSRFRWIARPGNDLYFVWMHNWLDVDDHLTTIDRNAAIKLLYTYRL